MPEPRHRRPASANPHPGPFTTPLLAMGKSGSLAQCKTETLLASNASRPSTTPMPMAGRAPATRAGRPRRGSLALIQGSLSGRQISRSSPLLGFLHRASDGTLIGLGVCLLGLGGLTLHWQNRWGESFHQLQSAQVLEHRMQESSAQLEQHYLSAVRRPGWLVPTSSEKLIYLSEPKAASPSPRPSLSATLRLGTVPAGY
jgi:hypothetical protein